MENNYRLMCFEAEKTGAIELSGTPSKVYHEDEHQIYWPEDYLEQQDEWEGIKSGEFARCWTSDELAGMIKEKILTGEGWDFGIFNDMLGKCWYAKPFKMVKIPELPFNAETLAECLLFAVMYDRGYLWTGKTFEKRDG